MPPSSDLVMMRATDLARAIRDQLVKGGRVRVALTRDDDRFLVLQERYGIARKMGADLFISIHADAAENTDAHGATVYTLSETASAMAILTPSERSAAKRSWVAAAPRATVS